MFKDKRSLGVLSAVVTFVAVVLVGVKAEVFGLVYREMLLLLTGGVRDIAVGAPPFLMMFPIILATVAIELPFTLLGGFFQAFVLGAHGKHALSESIGEIQEGHLFRDFFYLVLIEEILARWLFLGVLTKLPFLSGTFGFYLLFFLGNALWALIHLSNFKEEKDRHPLRVLPQFVAGLFFTYIYVKYGLLAVVLTHFASNAILFATHRVQNINEMDLLITAYAVFTTLTSYAFMEKPITDVMLWFQDNPTYTLPGWGVMDYLKLSVFVTSALMALFGFLLYDRGEAGKKHPGIFEHILGFPVLIIVTYILFTLLGIFFSSLPYRVLSIAIIYSFAHKSASGSAMTRTFWVILPDIFTSVCIIEALNFWPCLLWMALETLIHAPRTYMTQYDD
jgi:hypothetical protein